MTVDELFVELESAYRSSPWPWPRSMAEDQLDFWRQVFPQCTLSGGAYIGEKIMLRDANTWVTVRMS